MTRFLKLVVLGIELLCMATMCLTLIVFAMIMFTKMLSAIGICVLGYLTLCLLAILFATLILYSLGSVVEDSNELSKLKRKEQQEKTSIKEK